MRLEPQTQAIMLLTVKFGKSNRNEAKPLSASEWGKFAAWLRDQNLDPAALLKGDIHTQLSGWIDRSVTAQRIQSLLDRGAALGLALERWQRAGLWTLTRSDHEYPMRLKDRLGRASPPVLFGCGKKSLLNSRGLAVVGSRNASDEDLEATACLGKETAQQGLSVFSGGARGVDLSAMLGALESDGTAVGILADSLLRSAVSARYRKHVMSGDLVLVSPFNPEAGFNVGTAMARNRLIYCMADAAVVIHSAAGSGGTWNGATENLRKKWVPLWVKPDTAGNSGNSQLVELGARWLPESFPLPSELFAAPCSASVLKSEPVCPIEKTEMPTVQRTCVSPVNSAQRPDAAISERNPCVMELYDLFLLHLMALLEERPMKPKEVSSRLELNKSQTDLWLKRAVTEGKAEKISRPAVRYRWVQNEAKPKDLFGN